MASTYERGFSFAGFQSNRPATPLPGQQVDIELDSIARSLASQQAQIQALRPGGGPGLPVIDLPIAGRSLKVNLLSSPAIPQIVGFDQFKAELGIGSGGGSLPDWNDIQNKPVFGNAAQRNVGASAGTVAAGDDPRIVGALQAAQNGNDIPNKGLFRSALGLGAAALLAVGTAAGTVAAGDDPRFGSGVKTVLDYGAKGDSVTDDTAAFNAMLAAEKIVRIPGGKNFVIDGRVGSLTNNAKQQIIGAGHSLTMVWLGPNGGFDVSGEGWRVEGVHFVANGVVECAIKTGEGSDSTGSAIFNNRFSGAGTSTNYFKICIDTYNTWYIEIRGNTFKNCTQTVGYLGIGIRCNYSVNWSVSANSFYGFNIGYQWSDVASPNGGFYCEGHMLTGNQFVVNRFHVRFERGLAPMMVNNMLDLAKGDGAALVSTCTAGYFGFNWFAFLGEAPNTNACVVIGGESNTVANNTFNAGGKPDKTDGGGIGLALVNCTYSTVTGNKFRGLYRGLSAGGGCIDISISGNKFLNQQNTNADVTNVNLLTWYDNTRVSGAGFSLPGSYSGAGGGQSSGAASYANNDVFTTSAAAARQMFNFPIPGGIFSSTPIATCSLASNAGGPYIVSTDYDNSSATSVRFTIERPDGGTIGSGGAFRINLLARAAG